MRNILLAFALLVSPSAFAGSHVFWRVPDAATVAVDGADTRLATYRDAIAERQVFAARSWSDVEDGRSRERAARHALRDRREDVRDSCKSLKHGLRADLDPLTIGELRGDKIRAMHARDQAQARLESRKLDIEAAKAGYRVATVREKRAIAELELRQAALLEGRDADIAWMYRPGRFVRQVDRIDRAIGREGADYAIALAIAEDRRRDFVASIEDEY